jgi:hypothetical protein
MAVTKRNIAPGGKLTKRLQTTPFAVALWAFCGCTSQMRRGV